MYGAKRTELEKECLCLYSFFVSRLERELGEGSWGVIGLFAYLLLFSGDRYWVFALFGCLLWDRWLEVYSFGFR